MHAARNKVKFPDKLNVFRHLRARCLYAVDAVARAINFKLSVAARLAAEAACADKVVVQFPVGDVYYDRLCGGKPLRVLRGIRQVIRSLLREYGIAVLYSDGRADTHLHVRRYVAVLRVQRGNAVKQVNPGIDKALYFVRTVYFGRLVYRLRLVGRTARKRCRHHCDRRKGHYDKL